MENINKTKTLIVTSFFGLISRNILSTDFLEKMRSISNLRVIILTPLSKIDLYTKTYGGNNIFFEGFPSKKNNVFEKYTDILFLNSSDTSSRRIHRLIDLKEKKRLLNFVVFWVFAKLSNIKLYRCFLRWLYLFFYTKNSDVIRIFDLYKPDLIFSTDLFEPNDVNVLTEAKKRNIFTVGMIRSWDNITTKGLNKVISDKLIVNTPKIKEEAIKYCDFFDNNIFVVGIPHYDAYLKDKRISKEELFSRLGLDPKKKTIFFAPPGDIYTQGDSINSLILRRLSDLDIQIIVRFYIVGKANIGNIKPVKNKIAIDDPGSGLSFTDADLTGKDSHLADLLYHSDVVIAFASTLAIDAIVFNKPVVFINFDGGENRPYWKSLRRFYDYDHQKSIIESGGIRLANSLEDMILYLERYLDDSSLDEIGRQKIMKERCWRLDCLSGSRLADLILRLLK